MLIISTFPFLFDYFMFNMFFFFNNFPLGDLTLLGKYVLGQSIHHTYFCVGLFSCVVMFYGVFSLPFWMTLTSLAQPLLFILFLTSLFFSWILQGLWSSLTSILLGPFLVCLLVSFLLSIFIARWMTSTFLVSHFGFFFFPTKCVKRRFSPYM